MNTTLLGGLSPETFLRDYWQKKPLLIRNALPGFTGFISPEELAGLALEPEVEARIIRQQRGRFTLKKGPFQETDFTRLPARNWTLLVQGINLYLPEGRALLDRFNFIPHARLDDLMISYAPPGGTVGAHIDSYDVFLLQGLGHRRWQIADQQDLTLVPDAPIRLLAHFEPQEEWVLGPGDMLYLPPRYAHYGVALDDCTTYSIGFRAPSRQELCSGFLEYLAETIKVEGIYADPDLRPTSTPGEIDADMLARVQEILAAIHWDRDAVAGFLGRHLTEPKANVVFRRPRRISAEKFAEQVKSRGVRLHLQSQILFSGNCFFVNGEKHIADGVLTIALSRLANERKLPPAEYSGTLLEVLRDWHAAGWIEIGNGIRAQAD